MSERIMGEVAGLAWDGRLTMGAGADVVRDKVRSLLPQGHR